MDLPCKTDQRRRLAALVAEALMLADRLELPLVGIALDGVLVQLDDAPAVEAEGGVRR